MEIKIIVYILSAIIVVIFLAAMWALLAGANKKPRQELPSNYHTVWDDKLKIFVTEKK